MRRRAMVLSLAALVGSAAAGLGWSPAAHAAASSTISGYAFHDDNRNGVLDTGESPFSGEAILLFNAAGTNVSSSVTDSAGRYSFANLADGTYRVEFSNSSWADLRHDWVPTTTGSLAYSRTVALSGSARADFGLRAIVRSTTAGSPISSYTGPSGLRVEVYDDVVDPRALHDDLLQGSLIGAEAAATVVRFDLGDVTVTYSGASQGADGSYTSYSATVDVAYEYWLTDGDWPLFHEYGHAWSGYFASLVQQDPSLAGYLQARGLAGDSRLGSNAYWDPKEMIAEDYRQLFGTASAAAHPQANAEIPAAADVPGLRTYLSTVFTQPPAGGSTTTSPPPPAPPAPAPTALAVTNLTVNPQPVTRSGAVSFDLNAAATTTVVIRSSSGAIVRTLLSKAAEPAGTVSSTWDRKDAKGKRVPAGTYSVSVSATDASGVAANASTTFTVS